MLVIAYPPYDAMLGDREVKLETKTELTLWALLQALGKEHPAFARELPAEPSDEALRSRLIPLGAGRVYSVGDVLSPDETVKLFPPVAGG